MILPPVRRATIFTITLVVWIGLSAAQQICWWRDLNAPSFGSAAAGDIDGDGRPEIVFGTYFNDERILALNAEDGSILWTYFTDGCNDASPVIYDVDLDGSLEVVVPASSPCRVYCLGGANGVAEWSYSTYPHSIDSPPAVGDLDGDGRPEVVFGAFQGYVYCLNGEDGSPVWQINLGTNSYIQSEPAILDCDGDSLLDVVVAQWNGDHRVYALRGHNGSTLWYSDLPEDWMYHGASFGDIDGDGRPELAIGSYDGDLYVLNGEDGSLVWEYPGALYLGAPTSLADLNNDGHLEIVFAAYNTLKVVFHTGGLLWSCPTGGSIFRGAAVADADGNGIPDLAFGSDDGILRMLRGDNGAELWTNNLQAHYGRTFEMDHAPVIGDFDGDDSLEIFIVGGYGTSSQPANNHGRAYMLEAGAGSGPGWPMFRHDPSHSGRFPGLYPPVETTLTPAHPPIVIPAVGGVFQYRANLRNTTAQIQTFQVWTRWRNPLSVWVSLLGPVGLILPGNASVTRQRSQNVAGSNPAGIYAFVGYAGPNAATIWDSSFFTFTKSAVDFGGEWVSNNNNWGEPFPGVEVGAETTPTPTSGRGRTPALRISPNPFNPTTTITLTLPQAGWVKVEVFDLQGRNVGAILRGCPGLGGDRIGSPLREGWYEAGSHEITFDGSNLASGVYLLSLQGGGQIAWEKMVLIR